MKTLLITPPFSQLNTPYPATTYLTSFLRSKGFSTEQRDIGIDTICRIFSSKGLSKIFKTVSKGRVGVLKRRYLETIDPVISFLQGKNPTLAYQITSTDYLPRGDRFDQLDIQGFGEMGTINHARYLATLYLNDIADYITQYIDPDFGFSRYSESLGVAQSSFSALEEKLNSSTLITSFILESFREEFSKETYDNIGITIPFPGNLIPALLIAKEAKSLSPNVNVFIGGGWVNTELRNLTDSRLFNYVDYILLDDGESPLERLLKKLKGQSIELSRTYHLDSDGKVIFNTATFPEDYSLNELPAPTYKGLYLDKYISIIDSTNPMHSLWNNGRWNKLTLAHGCYWKRCAFCDVTLPYIKDYHQSTASTIVDKIETIIEETGETGFHFVDEAAPPALLKEMALELLRRGITITWWTNIRFEKSFSGGLSKLLSKSGCIGVSGGIEVASDRLLKFMDKGVSVEQVATVAANLGRAGIMVHGYLMYGFPTQTIQETVDALEVVRQLFATGNLHSAYWHQFSLTAHSRVGEDPDFYNVNITGPEFQGFALNDLEFQGLDYDPSIFSRGLKASLYNYMRGEGLHLKLSSWFDFKLPKTTIKRDFIDSISGSEFEIKDTTSLIWIGEGFNYEENWLYLYDNQSQERINIDRDEGHFIIDILSIADYRNSENLTLKDVDSISEEYDMDTDSWLSSETASILYSYGLILI